MKRSPEVTSREGAGLCTGGQVQGAAGLSPVQRVGVYSKIQCIMGNGNLPLL